MNLKKILLSLLCLTFIICLSGCKEKKALTISEFKDIMKKYNYVLDETASKELLNKEENKILKDAIIEKNEESKTTITFYTLNNLKDTKEFFNNTSIAKEIQKGSISNNNTNNYQSLSLINGDNYSYIARFDNTIIEISSKTSNEEAIQELLKKIDY